MAGPLSGIGGQAQVPLSSASQPRENDNQGVRENQEQRPQENTVQPQNAAAAESQKSQTEDQRRDVEIRAQEQAAQSNREQRGSVLDITV